MRVWNDKVYLFVGTRTLHVFDLVSEEWSLLATTLQSGVSWPYSAESPLEAFNTAILDGKLYVFGGDDGKNPLGHNIFVVLDLSTNRWEHISGTSTHRPQSFEPNLRSLSSMWAAPRQRKIYILYGSANRTKARHRSAPGGGEDDYTYDDFWSYHVDDKKWEREPVVYGGYHGSLPTLETTPGHQKQSYTFSFFGDTFHVLVRGFPSYRAMSTFANDPDTGKIYLSGGYSNSDFVPAKNVATRVYHDVWTLKLDLPGGHWNPQDLTRDLRAEKMGPWMRCFTCGNCGITWQKCSGACGGKYYFCSKECQRSGWKEHKEKHSCRKL
ncbi:hypothetical protein BDP27DRAFT_1384447 [Rhodocollybia butyracea]|uniref:MYND-type domain-containing protein n=1 Tax=Rhodocollybia butyracea TaxID=206335 RepID=A0A9P5PM08_9AGAR|nr:hypothetical protein BDP27DRAFT_1384447 [Rhodocollybia butyracea]